MNTIVRTFFRGPLFPALMLWLGGASFGWAQPGSLDPAFHRYSVFDGVVYASAVQSDGKVVLGGAFTSVTGVPRRGIARVTSTGTLDPGFDPGIGVEGAAARVYALALCTNGSHLGKTVIGGSFTGVSRAARGGVARLHPNGALDPSFDPGAGVEGGDVYAVALQPDGKVLVGGNFTTVQQKLRLGVARFNEDGTLDTTFTTGLGADGTVYGLAVQTDGKIVVGGAFSTFRGASRPGIARLTNTGALDAEAAFQPGTGAEDGSVYALALQADGKILLGGDFTSVQGASRDGVARLNTDGRLDTGFAPESGGTSWVTVWAVAPATGDKVLAAGEFTALANAPADGIVRLDSAGNPDLTFASTRPEGALFNVDHGEYVFTMAVQNDGGIVAGGTFELVDNLYRPGLVRLHPTGAVDRLFNQESGTFDAVLASAVQPDGKLLLAGQFTLVNGESRRGLARLQSDGLLDTSFLPGAGVVGKVFAVGVYTNGALAGRIVIGGAFTNVDGVAVNGVARLLTNGSVDGSFRPRVLKSEVDALALQSDGKVIIGGPFTTVEGVTRNGIARLNPDGRLDTSFDPGTGIAGEAVYALTVEADGAVVIGGAFASYNGAPRGGLARLDPLGALDTRFNPQPGLGGGAVRAVVVQPNGHLVAGGGFTSANGTPRPGLARFQTNGDLDTAFDPGEGIDQGEIRCLVLQSNGQLVIGGSFTHFDHLPSGGLARLNPDGRLDLGFDPGSGVSLAKATVHALALQPDGQVLVGGSFLAVDGVQCWGITRLLGGSAVPTPPRLVWWPAELTALADDPVSLSVSAVGSKPLHLQWYFEGGILTGQTNGLLLLPSVTANQAGAYQVVITNSYGAATSPPVVLHVIPTVDLPPALDAPGLTWAIGGDRRWYGQAAVTHDGVAAAQSGSIGDDQQSLLSTTVTGPGRLSFWWKVSCEEDYDGLEFHLDDTPSAFITGEIDWNQRTFPIPPGPATLTWAYTKDLSDSAGHDAGWLDQVSYTQAPVLLPALTPDLALRLSIEAAPGQRVEIQASTTLTNWTTLVVLTNAGALLQFVDEGSTNDPWRFYRGLTP